MALQHRALAPPPPNGPQGIFRCSLAELALSEERESQQFQEVHPWPDDRPYCLELDLPLPDSGSFEAELGTVS